MAAQCAVDDHDIVAAMLAKDDKAAAINHIKGSRFRDMNKKANRGTIVHAAVEAYLNGKPMTKKQMQDRLDETNTPKALWQSTAGMIAGVMEFLFDAEPEVFYGEHALYNRTHEYAGTADILGRLRVGGAQHNAVIDVKTSKSIYDEVALQLVAYARAEFVGLNDGTEAPLIPDLGKTVAKKKLRQKLIDEGFQYGIVLRPKANGTYERADFTLTDEVFQMFLACLAVTNAGDNDVLARSRRPNTN